MHSVTFVVALIALVLCREPLPSLCWKRCVYLVNRWPEPLRAHFCSWTRHAIHKAIQYTLAVATSYLVFFWDVFWRRYFSFGSGDIWWWIKRNQTLLPHANQSPIPFPSPDRRGWEKSLLQFATVQLLWCCTMLCRLPPGLIKGGQKFWLLHLISSAINIAQVTH